MSKKVNSNNLSKSSLMTEKVNSNNLYKSSLITEKVKYLYSFNNIELDDLYKTLSNKSKESFNELNKFNIENIQLFYLNSLDTYNKLVINNRRLNEIILKFKKININNLDENTKTIFLDINIISRILALLLKYSFEYEIYSIFNTTVQNGGCKKNISKKNKEFFIFTKVLLDNTSYVIENSENIVAAGLVISGYSIPTVAVGYVYTKAAVSILKLSIDFFDKRYLRSNHNSNIESGAPTLNIDRNSVVISSPNVVVSHYNNKKNKNFLEGNAFNIESGLHTHLSRTGSFGTSLSRTGSYGKSKISHSYESKPERSR